MLRFLSAILLGQLAAAVDHGPFVQWYHDPCHEAEIRWVDRGSQASVIEGRWATGSAGFGYADHDDATAFPGMKDHYTSIALRHQISLQKKPQAGNQLVAEILYDDGFVLFIDGKEVLRKNAIGVDAAIKSGGAHEAEKWERFPLGEAAGLIKDGSIIAVQVVNDKIGSSDLSFDMSLTIQGKHSVSVILRKATWQYLAKTPPTGAWKTEFPALNEVVAPQAETSYLLGYRVAGEMDWQWQSARSHRLAQSDSRVFAVSLERLKADTRYEFVIRPKNSDALHGPHVIRTAPEAFRPMHFVIGGDMYHSRPLLDAMNKRAGLEDPLFAALIGDLAYANDQHVQRWYEWIDSWVQNAKAPDGRLIPMVIGMGNHEVLGTGYVPEKNTPGPEKSTQFYSLFRMGQRGDRAISYYNLDFGNYLSLVLLDSGHTQRISEQVDFVRDSLMSRRQVPFVFAAYHRPAWGAGVKENAVDIQQRWCPLFESLGVDAVFEHDHHCYKRTWPLIAGKRDDAKGIPYLGDGAWGVSVRKPDAQTRAKRPWVAQEGAVNHFFRVTLREQDFHCEAMSADGKVFDQAVYPKRP